MLRGDTELTRDLIDSIDRKWKFTAGVLSWHPDDKISPEQEERIMKDFESVAFAGLEPDQRNILWVRHSHAGHHELHFVIPRVELSSGKAFNPCPPGWQKHFDVFRDLYNHREGWARPDDPARARLRIPEHADLHNARLLRWGKTPKPEDRAAAKEAVHEYLWERIEQGAVACRADVLTALQEVGLEINRAGKEYITVIVPSAEEHEGSLAEQGSPPQRRRRNSLAPLNAEVSAAHQTVTESKEKLRLKGGIYAEHWKFEQSAFPGRAHQGQDRAGRPGDQEPDPATIRTLEQELVRIIGNRAQYNRKRYPQQYRGIGEEHHFPLPEPGEHLQPEVPVLHPVERGDSGDDHIQYATSPTVDSSFRLHRTP